MRLIAMLFLVLCTSVSICQKLIDNFLPQQFENRIFAHRGGYSNGPENHVKTILNTISTGHHAIEIDVMITSDNHLILFHDETISRILQSEKELVVSSMSLAEIKQIPLRNRSFGKQYVTSFEELIESINHLNNGTSIADLLFEVDFKVRGDKIPLALEKIVEAMNKLKLDQGDNIYNHFFVSTFYPDVMKEMNKDKYKFKYGFAINSAASEKKLMAQMGVLLSKAIVKKYNASIIEPNMCLVTNKFVRKWHKRGILINAYTANTLCQKQGLEKHNIAYTTNCPGTHCEMHDSDQMGKAKKWCKKCE